MKDNFGKIAELESKIEERASRFDDVVPDAYEDDDI